MMEFFFGLLLFLLPFVLVFRFENKRLGLLYALTVSILFHTILSFATQLAHQFTYINIVFLTVLFALGAFIWAKPQNLRENFLVFVKKWREIVFVLFLIITATYTLSLVHFNYSGEISVITTPDYQTVKNFQYPFPYYSDEWYAIAFVQDMIERGSLVSDNPLLEDGASFKNYELAFHAFLAEIFLLLGVGPLSGYVYVTIFFGVLLVLLAYLFLTLCGVHKIPAGIAALSILYITSSANLPGLWTLLPSTLGVLMLIVSLAFLSQKQYAFMYLSSFLMLVFYPPFLALFLPAYLFENLFKRERSLKEKKVFVLNTAGLISVAIIFVTSFFVATGGHNKEAAYTLIAFIAIVTASFFILKRKKKSPYITLQSLSFFWVVIFFGISYLYAPEGMTGYFKDVFSVVFYETFTEDSIPQYAIYRVVPLASIVLFLIGAKMLLKNYSWLFAAIIAGAFYWILYSFVTFRILIEYQRVVYATSVLIVLCSGFGLFYIWEYLAKTKIFEGKKNALLYSGTVCILFFLVFSFTYTKQDEWKKLVLIHTKTGALYSPAAPANAYLHPDDLRIFSKLIEERFLSIEWKGTVIGVATGNIPLATKSGTISINAGLPTFFYNASCEEKLALAKAYNLAYVYFPQFECEGFTEVEGEKSDEGLILYKTL